MTDKCQGKHLIGRHTSGDNQRGALFLEASHRVDLEDEVMVGFAESINYFHYGHNRICGKQTQQENQITNDAFLIGSLLIKRVA